MRIGYLLQEGVPELRRHPLSGPAIHVQQVVRELQNQGHQVRVLARLDRQIYCTADLQNFSRLTIPWLDHGPIRLLERVVRRTQYELRLPYLALFESVRFARACMLFLPDCDLFYERMGWMGYGGALAARIIRKPLILEINGDHLSELKMRGMEPKGLQRWLSMRLMQAAIHQTNHFVASGAGWRDLFIQRWHVAPGQITVIENGSRLVETLKRSDLKSFLPLEQQTSPPIVVYIGAFEAWHGIPILLQATRSVLDQGIQFRLRLIGSGPLKEEIQEIVRELTLEPQVDIVGRLSFDQLAENLATADIGVSPYCGRAEYSGLKLIDYKAAGLAIITSGEHGQPAEIEHGQTGWVVPPCDVEALAAALLKLIQEPALRIQLGQNARLEAEQIHSWRQTANALEQVFKQVIQDTANG